MSTSSISSHRVLAPASHPITGTPDSDNLDGTDRADLIDAQGGDDRVEAYDGNDTVDGGDGNDIVFGDGGDDILLGRAGDDTLVGGGQSDRLYGGAGADRLVSEYSDGKTQQAILLSGGAGDDHIEASAPGAALTVLGGDGDDVIAIAGNLDKVSGGAGDDELMLNDVDGKVHVDLGAGADVVTFQRYEGDGLKLIVSHFDAGDGGDRLDILPYVDGQLNGWDHDTNPFKAGYLELVQSGDDAILRIRPDLDAPWRELVRFVGTDATTLTGENLGGYPPDGSLPKGFEIVGGKGDDNLGGDIGPDTLEGLQGADTLFGGSGDDRIFGGAGDDYLDGVLGDDTVHGGAGNDRIEDYQPLNDKFFGDAGDDTIIFNGAQSGGKLLMSGGDGADTIDFNFWNIHTGVAKVLGGAGDDVVHVVNAGRVVVDAGSGADRVELAGVLDHAEVTLGDGHDTVAVDFSNEGDRHLTDLGVTAADRDVVDVSAIAQFWSAPTSAFADGHLRLAQVGGDTVLQVDYSLSGDHWATLLTLDGIDARSLSGANFRLSDRATTDLGQLWTLGGESGDSLHTSAAFERLDGAGGDDVLNGDDNANVLLGGAGADTLSAAGGADTLFGGDGGDVLTGGGGSDTFVFNALAASAPGTPDLIKDLAAGDTVDLSKIDADVTQDGDDAFQLVATLDGHAGELALVYDVATNTTRMEMDVDGDGVADAAITAAGDQRAFTHFVL